MEELNIMLIEVKKECNRNFLKSKSEIDKISIPDLIEQILDKEREKFIAELDQELARRGIYFIENIDD